MNWFQSQAFTFLLGAIVGPLVMFLFQYLKKLGGWIDGQPVWAKQAWLFVLTQAIAMVAALTQSGISCDTTMTASDCLGQLTPEILKGLIMQGAAIASYKLKQAKPSK